MPKYIRPQNKRRGKLLTYKEVCHRTLINWNTELKPGDTPNSYVMPTGRFKGLPLHQVPKWYLIWVYENDKCNPEVKNYVERNIDVLRSITGRK